MNASMAVAIGLGLGLRHATDADHVVALSTLLRRKAGLRGALVIGAVWGVGHTLVLLAAGVAVVLLGIEIPPRLDRLAELAVAVMLVGLGLHHLVPARKTTSVAGPATAAFRPLLIGMVHGLAGSGAAALLALTTIRVPGVAMLYLSLFGLGTVVGMMALTSLMALPLCYARQSRRLEVGIVRVASAASLGLGLLLAVRCSFFS